MQGGRRTFWLMFAFLCLRRPSPTIDATIICSLFPDFTPEQTNLCVKNPQVVSAISTGVNIALRECEYQFHNQRWNCRSSNDKSSFGQTRAVPGTKEAAYMSAIVAAGVAHAVTRECAKGNISSCSCDKTNEGKTSPEGYKWGGCSDDINYGIAISNTFLDRPRGSINKKYELLNRHNSDTGRRVLTESAVVRCICYGTTWTCPVKTCWKVLPPLRRTGEKLYSMYKIATRVKPVSIRSRQGLKPISLMLYETNEQAPKKPPAKVLVYFYLSPLYCDKDKKRGILGSKGRICQKSTEPNSLGKCTYLCCGRGYDVQIQDELNSCNCTFHWCCMVDCQVCKVRVELFRCK